MYIEIVRYSQMFPPVYYNTVVKSEISLLLAVAIVKHTARLVSLILFLGSNFWDLRR